MGGFSGFAAKAGAVAKSIGNDSGKAAADLSGKSDSGDAGMKDASDGLVDLIKSGQKAVRKYSGKRDNGKS